MSKSLLINCACCNKPVVAKHKSKERTCSHRCYMTLWRKKKAAEQSALEDQVQSTVTN